MLFYKKGFLKISAKSLKIAVKQFVFQGFFLDFNLYYILEFQEHLSMVASAHHKPCFYVFIFNLRDRFIFDVGGLSSLLL